MDAKQLQGIVLRVVLSELAKQGERFVPVSSSNRHVHLCQADVERLFGVGYQLTQMRALAQPGQYACNETVIMEAPKGKLTLRVVGPVRKETQIELSYTDCFKVGIPPMLRMSGEIQGTPGCVLANGERRAAVQHGVIVAARHLHMSADEAQSYGLRDGDQVSLLTEGERACALDKLIVRCGAGHSLEAHIDKDEANASGIRDGQLCRIVLPNVLRVKAKQSNGIALAAPASADMPVLQTYVPKAKPLLQAEAPKPQTYTQAPAAEIKTTMLDLSYEVRCFISEEEVLLAAKQNHKLIRYAPDAIITPLAKDAASARGIELIERV